MMRIYEVSMNAVAVTGAITMVQIKAGSSNTVKLIRAWCSQSNLTTSGMQPIEIVRKTGAATVTTFTPLLYNSNDSAAGSAGGTSATGTNATAEGTDGNVLYYDNFNVMSQWLWLPTPEEWIVVPPSGIIGLKFPVAPGSSMTTSAGFIFGEE